VRVRVFLAVIFALLIIPAVAHAKGPDQATIDGPGMTAPASISGTEGASGDLSILVELAGLFPAAFGQTPDPMLATAPDERASTVAPVTSTRPTVIVRLCGSHPATTASLVLIFFLRSMQHVQASEAAGPAGTAGSSRAGSFQARPTLPPPPRSVGTSLKRPQRSARSRARHDRRGATVGTPPLPLGDTQTPSAFGTALARRIRRCTRRPLTRLAGDDGVAAHPRHQPAG
jgi:hypothetical protein